MSFSQVSDFAIGSRILEQEIIQRVILQGPVEFHEFYQGWNPSNVEHNQVDLNINSFGCAVLVSRALVIKTYWILLSFWLLSRSWYFTWFLIPKWKLMNFSIGKPTTSKSSKGNKCLKVFHFLCAITLIFLVPLLSVRWSINCLARLGFTLLVLKRKSISGPASGLPMASWSIHCQNVILNQGWNLGISLLALQSSLLGLILQKIQAGNQSKDLLESMSESLRPCHWNLALISRSKWRKTLAVIKGMVPGMGQPEV